ncbi:MAG: serine protease [Nitrospirales bacterium]
MSRYIFLIFIFQWIFFSQILAQTLPEKWAEKARQSVVFIKIPVTDPIGGGVDNLTATGFIISKDGHILTAQHILKKWLDQSPSQKTENEIKGRVGGNTSDEIYPLTPVSFDDHKDVLLMKLKSDRNDFEPLPLCFYQDISEGSSFVAVGYPLGNDLQVTDGIIGNNNADGGRWAVNSDFTFGMSGGPVFNMNGVIGIVKGGEEGEPALRWITPIRLASNYLKDAPGFLTCGGQGDLRAMVFMPVKPTNREKINVKLEQDVLNSLISSFTSYRIEMPKIAEHMTIRAFKHLSEAERQELNSFNGCHSIGSSSQIWKKVKYLTSIEYSLTSSPGVWSLHIETWKLDKTCELHITDDVVYNDNSTWNSDTTSEYLLKKLNLWLEKSKVLLFPPFKCKMCTPSLSQGEALSPFVDFPIAIPEHLERNVRSLGSFKNIRIKNLDDRDRRNAQEEYLQWYANQDEYKSVTHFLPGEIEYINSPENKVLIYLELYKRPLTKDSVGAGTFSLPVSMDEIIKFLRKSDLLGSCCPKISHYLNEP